MKTHIAVLTMGTLAVVPLFIGCGAQPADPSSAQAATSGDHGHSQTSEDGGHAHGAGPHDGTLADWGGGKYHVEFTVDHTKQEATVYVLGGDEKTPSPIDVEEIQLSIKDPMMQVALSASPLQGDPEGSASRFIGTHEGLGVVQEYEGTIIGVVDATPYSGNFKEEPHAHQQ